MIFRPGIRSIQSPNMITPARRQPNLKAYTIIESLVVLVILATLTMVLIALVKYQKEAPLKKGKASTAPLSAPADPSPAPRIEDGEK